MSRTAILIGTMLAGLCAAVAARQAPQSTFKAGVDIVHVEVSVLDGNRKPVRGLTANDFTVLEDGKPRPIAAFTPVDLPEMDPSAVSSPATWTRDIAPDVMTNDLPREGRLVVVLIDQTLRLVQQPLARRLARSAIQQLAPNDLAAVVQTVGGTPQDFTVDRTRLLTAVDRTSFGLSDSEPWLNGTPGNRDLSVSQSSAANSPTRGICPCGVCTVDSITRIAEALRDAPRRKMMLLVGTDVALQSNDPQCPEVNDLRNRMYRALDVANLTVHVLDPTGLETLARTAEQPSTTTRLPSDRTAINAANLSRQGNLTVIADRTGGRTLTNMNDPDKSMSSVFSESRSYYSLGFRSADPTKNGEYHGISIRVNRRDVTVHARRGYYAPGGPPAALPLTITGPPQPLVDAVKNVWPATRLPIAVSASAFAMPGKPQTLAAIVMRTRRPTSASALPDDGTINVLAAAFDRNGRSVNYEFQRLAITSKAEPGTDLDIEILSKVPIEPGRYEIRTAIGDARFEIGSAYTYLDIPDFSKAPLSMSGAMLSVVPAAIAAPETAFEGIMPLVPTNQRTFRTTDHVRAFVRVYQGGSDPVAPVTMTTRILNASGKSMLDERNTLAAGRFDQNRAADHELDLPVDRLTPGEYLLTFAAAAGKRTERRDVRFQVR